MPTKETEAFWGSMPCHQLGLVGGRLARHMADAVEHALTEEAVKAVLEDFRKTLEKPGQEGTHDGNLQ